VRWPIFAGGRIVYNVRVQNERQAQALAQYEKTVLSAFSETESVLTAYIQQRNRFEALTRALKASNRALELSQELYKQGVSDFQRVLDAQRNVFASEDSLAISEQELLVGVVAIYKTLGGDWLAEVVPPAA
jgi:outer membrane protein TolC